VVSQDVVGLEFPNRYLIKGPSGMLLLPGSFSPTLTKEIICNLDSVSYTLPSVYGSNSDSFSDTSSTDIAYDEDVIMKETEQSKQLKTYIGKDKLTKENSPDSGSLVLHPMLSAYAKRYPNYDVFSKEPLIDNGYVECGAGDLTPYTSALSPINSHAFSILSLPDVCDN